MGKGESRNPGGNAHQRHVRERTVQRGGTLPPPPNNPPPSSPPDRVPDHGGSSSRHRQFSAAHVLAFVGIGMSVIFYLLPKTPKVVVACLLLILLSFLWPVIHTITWASNRRAAEVKARVGLGSFLLVLVVVAFGIKTWPEPEVQMIFKSSLKFTPYHRWKITREADDFRNYLIEVGFDVPRQVPPLGVAPNAIMSGAVEGAGALGADMVIPEESLANPGDPFRVAYSEYLFGNLVPEHPKNLQESERVGRAVRIFADYYRCSYANKLSVFYPYPPDLGKWESALWELRGKYGREFMDKAMFYATKRWLPYGTDQSDKDFDSYFALRIEVGIAVFDNNGNPINEVREFWKQKGFIKQP